MTSKKSAPQSKSEPDKPNVGAKGLAGFIEHGQKIGAVRLALPVRNKRGLCVPAKPFKHGISYIALTKEAARIDGTLLLNKDLEYLKKTFHGLDLEKNPEIILKIIRHFLVKECNVRVSELTMLTWREILGFIRCEKIQPTAEQPDGELSKPMSKSKMMAALKVDSYKTFNAWAKDKALKQAGNRQTFTIRLDLLDPNSRQKLEKT